MAKLQLENVIGFGGDVQEGLKVHPDQKTLIYPLGSTLVLHDLVKDDDIFLEGHNGPITCVAVSSSGKYIASGQKTHMGFKAAIYIWDFEEKKMIHKMVLHKVKVQSLCFSPNEQYLLSIGGQDDNNITIWDMESGKPICGKTSSNLGLCTTFFNHSNDTFITAGKYMLKVWTIDFKNRNLISEDCRLGQVKRVITCMKLTPDDDFLFCGTTSGDMMCVQMDGPKNFKYSGPKQPIPRGILSLEFTAKGNILAGGGDGTLNVLDADDFRRKKSIKLKGPVTSITTVNGSSFYAGTGQSVIYHVSPKLDTSLIKSCHSERINDVVYPGLTSEVIATCSEGNIRLWNVIKGKELVRIQLPNLECNCVTFSTDGSQIISGWSDGKIRSFGPQSGKLLYVINSAHKITGQKKISGTLLGVTAVASTHNNKFVVSGGSDGQVRVWAIGYDSQQLVATLKEHKSTINSIAVRQDDSECITASDDGSCIVWNLERYVRSNILSSQTYFKQCCYLNDESQILTAGSDKQVVYWDSYDGSAIRELEASTSELHALDISPDGEYFVAGGKDKIVSLWEYDQGEMVDQETAHSGAITKIRFSPDQKYVTSVGTEGAIMLWKFVE
mmetsp:Transcript_3004/g.4402  ORF Transcript_3004/g.4402 Transcript_3004/m.4402 type:complete len:613 (+) Transcript_3004:164-2002(+)